MCRPCLESIIATEKMQALAEQIAKVQAMARHLGREGRLSGSQALIDAVLTLSAEVA